MGAVSEAIRRKLEQALTPERLEITDDSDKHAGHSGHREGGESHFTLMVVAQIFDGMGRVQRQRRINEILAEELAGPVHALSIKALAPGEN